MTTPSTEQSTFTRTEALVAAGELYEQFPDEPLAWRVVDVVTDFHLGGRTVGAAQLEDLARLRRLVRTVFVTTGDASRAPVPLSGTSAEVDELTALVERLEAAPPAPETQETSPAGA